MKDIVKDLEVSQLADLLLAGSYNGLNARLRELSFDWETKGIKAEGNFYYLSFKDGVPSTSEFVEFVYHKIVPFCLPRKYVKDCIQKLTETGDERYFFEAADKAKQLFIKAKKKLKRSGEPGEVILFILLEGFLQAPRIVSKMDLKTNRNVEVFGSDAIHVKYDLDNQLLILYWGEAKLYQNLNGALERICLSIKGFHTPDEDGEEPRKRDIYLVQDHSDIDDDALKEAIVQFFDPYSEYSNQVREIHACLAVWDWELYKKIEGTPPENIEALFIERYKDKIETSCMTFLDKTKEHSIDNLYFHLFLLPLEDVAEFRKRFFQKIGIADYD